MAWTRRQFLTISAGAVVGGGSHDPWGPRSVADGLRRLGDLGKYMNRDQDRYWLSLQVAIDCFQRDKK